MIELVREESTDRMGSMIMRAKITFKRFINNGDFYDYSRLLDFLEKHPQLEYRAICYHNGMRELQIYSITPLGIERLLEDIAIYLIKDTKPAIIISTEFIENIEIPSFNEEIQKESWQ